jgi:sulfate adenylyltransferase
MIAPHGGVLLDLFASAEREAELRSRAASLPRIVLSQRQLNDLDLLAIGALSPLTGFMGQADYEGVVADMRLANGLLWSIPVTLAVHSDDAPARAGEVALYDATGQLRAILDMRERFTYDKKREAKDVYGTEDGAHPGVAAIYAQGDVLLGGPVTVLRSATEPDPYHLTPAQTRAAFAARGWKTIVGFQTRNPVHRAHEYIQKCAMEVVDGLLLHPLVGETKADDIPADVRMECYKVLLENYYPKDRVLLAAMPASMRYAGPREAVFHALIRKNYGCTHFIVGRDHAGVGNYYGTYDAQRLMDTIPPSDLGITPLKFENSFYCHSCEGMASDKTCPHGNDVRVSLSGSAVRAMLVAGELPPPEFSRPEVARILIDASRPIPVNA